MRTDKARNVALLFFLAALVAAFATVVVRGCS